MLKYGFYEAVPQQLSEKKKKTGTKDKLFKEKYHALSSLV